MWTLCSVLKCSGRSKVIYVIWVVIKSHMTVQHSYLAHILGLERKMSFVFTSRQVSKETNVPARVEYWLYF